MAGSGRGVRPATPRNRRGRPPNARGPRRRRSTRGDQGGLFLSRVTSGPEDFLTEGTLQHEAASAAGRAVWKGRSGDPPRSRPRSGSPPPPFCGSKGVGVTLCASPPRLGRPVAWREVSRKARIDVMTVAVTAYNGGPAGARDRAHAESFSPSEIRHRPSEIRDYRGCRRRKPGSNRLAPFLLL